MLAAAAIDGAGLQSPARAPAAPDRFPFLSKRAASFFHFPLAAKFVSYVLHACMHACICLPACCTAQWRYKYVPDEASYKVVIENSSARSS